MAYKCMCDHQRIRILHLLQSGPLCVCHLQKILEVDPIKLSKQLKYMKTLGMVVATREANWKIYRLAEPEHVLLQANLRCLGACAGEELPFEEDLRKREELIKRIRCEEGPCPEGVLTS